MDIVTKISLTFFIVFLFLYFTKPDLIYKNIARKGKVDYDYHAFFILLILISTPISFIIYFLS